MAEIKILTPKSPLYPKNLLGLIDMPKKLYVLGKILDSDQSAVAIIGSRNMTQHGKKIAWDFSYFLARKGITIISGLARGIDTIVHQAALKVSGRTIAVLANGLEKIYPPENSKLAQEIIKSGAVVSEYPPGAKMEPKNFLVRNRLISGLARGVLVIEGKARSGTLSTASHAANQGREVFAIPGSLATDWLIEQGASVATTPKDVLDYLDRIDLMSN
ncbi:MAG: DNA-processing protein DprA [Patescibacteria group bacterium]